MAKNLLQNNCDLVSVTPVAASAQPVNTQGRILCKKSTSTTIAFTDLAQYPYTEFELLTVLTVSGVGAGNLSMQGSVNNGAAYLATGYLSQSVYMIANATTSTIGSSTTSNLMLAWAATSATVLMCRMYIYGINTTNLMIRSNGGIFLPGGASSNQFAGYTGGYITNASPFNAFQVLLSTGSITAAKTTLWGING